MQTEIAVSLKPIEYHIIDITAKYYGTETDVFVQNDGRFINQETAYKKHVCYYLLRKYTFLSFAKIGLLFNKSDHAPVKWGFNKIDDLISYDYRTITEIAELKRQIDNFKAKLHQ